MQNCEKGLPRFSVTWAALLAVVFLFVGQLVPARARQPEEAVVLRGVDAAVKARQDAIAAYSVTEHYAVFRNDDEVHPAAEMTVKTDYKRDSGKNYNILSESGSDLIRKFVLMPILDREKQINQPGNREGSWITSANYKMQLKFGDPQRIDGRDCLELSINPKQKAPNLIAGNIWVDAKDDSIVLLKGTASKSVSHFTGPTEVMRQYANVDGFAMATHARARSESFIFGSTVVTIDYSNYSIQHSPIK